MITLHETHFLLILIIVTLITYMISSYYTDCSVDCKINYYKYENYSESSKLSISVENHRFSAAENW